MSDFFDAGLIVFKKFFHRKGYENHKRIRLEHTTMYYLDIL